MNATQTAIPAPIVRERRVRNGDGSAVILSESHRKDHFNLTTGEVRVARIINGVRYDTMRAILIVSWSTFDAVGDFQLRQLYRSEEGRYFTLHMEWTEDSGFVGPDFLSPIVDEGVMIFARLLVTPTDSLQFLLEWYCTGWLPRNDAFAQDWAEKLLSADDCETVLAELTRKSRSPLAVSSN